MEDKSEKINITQLAVSLVEAIMKSIDDSFTSATSRGAAKIALMMLVVVLSFVSSIVSIFIRSLIWISMTLLAAQIVFPWFGFELIDVVAKILW